MTLSARDFVSSCVKPCVALIPGRAGRSGHSFDLNHRYSSYLS